jgi:N-acetyl-anhydromuramyl-L-alanine amidase AmpD
MNLKDAILSLIELLKQFLLKQEPAELSLAAPHVDYDSFSAPKINFMKGVKYKTHGKFKTKSGKALGATPHYTVSGRSALSAQGVVKYLAKEGLGCLVMDEKGEFWAPEGYNYRTDVVYHAGASSWNGKAGMSSYCIGLEICNWGTDALKRGAKDIRVVKVKTANQKPGTYQAYTEAQEKSLINFLKYEKATNPEFSYDWVAGHDEIAPTRKSDPGGSLSMTMPELRATLKA